MSLNLKELLVTNTDKLTTKVEFKDTGIIIEVRYVSRAELQRISRTCVTQKYEKSSNRREPSVDGAQFAAKFTERAVIGWSGATPAKLSKLIPLDTAKLTPAQLNEELPFDKDNFSVLLANAFDLDAFLQETATDLTNFEQDKVTTEGNSAASQSGN